jgi:hypothetical protein
MAERQRRQPDKTGRLEDASANDNELERGCGQDGYDRDCEEW